MLFTFSWVNQLIKSLSEQKAFESEQNKDLNGLEGNTSEGASIYGTAQRVSDRRIVKQIARNYLDILYK